MSLYSFAATNLTTPVDRRRRPAVNQAQITRTFAMVFVFLAGLTAMVHHGRAQNADRALIAAPASAPAIDAASNR